MNSSVRVCLFAVLFAGALSASPHRESPLLFAQHPAADGGTVQFSARVSGGKLLFDASGTVSGWGSGAGTSAPQPEIAMRLLGARLGVAPRAAGTPAGSANYLVGSHPDEWRIGLPLFGKIIYSGVYPGIDLVYYGNQKQLEYDFMVAPGASWRSIRLAFSGAQAIAIDSRGDLKLKTRGGWLRHCRPRVYQQLASGRREISGHYVLQGKRHVSFEIGAYDPNVPLVIDPTLVYSSYLGGSAADHGNSVAVDSAGCAYTVGETGSANFALLNTEQGALAGNTDIFVTKWNAAGTGILYSTYIGGSNRDVPLSIAVDAAGSAYIAGYTDSADFPLVGALRSNFSSQTKAFVLKLNPTGNSLIYSTFLGGSGNDTATGIAVDANGQAYVSGYTESLDFPVSSGASQSHFGGGVTDGFFAKLNAAGSKLIYATYLGGSGNDTATAVALDPAANVYLTGQTQSSNFPLLHPFQATSNAADTDAFVVKLNTSGVVLYATYLGSTGASIGTGIAADAAGNAYVAGNTTAPDFPVTAGAYQPVNHGKYETFVAKLSADGSAIPGATYFGGSGSENTFGIALDSAGDVFVAGSTNSIDLPLQAPVEARYSGAGDAFVAEFNNQLTSLYFSTYYGGAGSESLGGIAVDASGNAYLTGSTNGSILVTAGALQTSRQGGFDAFLAKFSSSGSSPLICGASSPGSLNIPAGGSAEQVGDLVLTCTGGTAGSTAMTDILLTLNANVASGMQPELLIDNPASQVSNVNLFLGIVNGTSILFSGISFPVPGAAASHILRITNVLVNAATVPSPGQVVATASAMNSAPALTVMQPQQIVATAGVAVQSFVMSGSAAPANCVAPPAVTTFLASALQALLWFQVTGAAAGDVIRTDWYAPGGTLYQSSTMDAGPGSGNQCFWSTMNIAGSSVSMSGAWQVSAYWNNDLLFSAPFSISTSGGSGGSRVKELVWQNDTARQVTANYYSGATMTGWNWLNAAGSPGWKVVAVADMNGDGVPDLIWQNDTTRQVTVNYYGGAGGSTVIGWNWLKSAGSPGWKVVAAADMNGDGVPDLIWQNDATRQVTVNYYGGTGGATLIGSNWLKSASSAGWTVVAAADMNGDGVPDLIWQNDTTRQVTVNYYGGTGGATLVGSNWLKSASSAGWTVVAAADMNGDGVPDLIWQSDTTRQVTVNYYSGTGGVTVIGWNWLNQAGSVGWTAVGVE